MRDRIGHAVQESFNAGDAIFECNQLQAPGLGDIGRHAFEARRTPSLGRRLGAIIEADLRNGNVVYVYAARRKNRIGYVGKTNVDTLPGVGSQVNAFGAPAITKTCIESRG